MDKNGVILKKQAIFAYSFLTIIFIILTTVTLIPGVKIKSQNHKTTSPEILDV